MTLGRLDRRLESKGRMLSSFSPLLCGSVWKVRTIGYWIILEFPLVFKLLLSKQHLVFYLDLDNFGTTEIPPEIG
jgi:hypothetical protein